MSSASIRLKRVSPRRWKQLVVVLIVASASLTAGYFQPSLQSAWTLATTHQAESYTELSFVRPSTLPAELSAGTTGRFTFVITNHEDEAVTYHYRVVRRAETQVAPGTVITDATVVVAAGDTRQIDATFTLPPGQARNAVGVVLVDHDQLISFWSVNR